MTGSPAWAAWALARLSFTALAGVLIGYSPTAVGGHLLSLRIVDRDGAPLPGIAVYLPGLGAGGATAPRLVIDQRDRQFVPPMSVIPIGTEVQFSNSDPISHHVYSFSRPNSFALPLFKGDARIPVRFDRPGVVVLGCNIHDAMLGYIVVVDSAYSAVTDAEGRVRLADVPAGRHEIAAWAPGLDRMHPEALGAVDVPSAGESAEFALKARVRSADPAPRARSLAGDDY